MQHSPDLLFEQAYLVSRGVRPLALVGHCEADELTMLRTATELERVPVASVIPFVCDRGDGVADYGYASESWAIDLYEWATKNENDAVPDVHRHRIVGLLLGYSAAAIHSGEEQSCGRRFRTASSE